MHNTAEYGLADVQGNALVVLAHCSEHLACVDWLMEGGAQIEIVVDGKSESRSRKKQALSAVVTALTAHPDNEQMLATGSLVITIQLQRVMARARNATICKTIKCTTIILIKS